MRRILLSASVIGWFNPYCNGNHSMRTTGLTQNESMGSLNLYYDARYFMSFRNLVKRRKNDGSMCNIRTYCQEQKSYSFIS